MNRNEAFASLALVGLLATAAYSAGVIHESATLGPTDAQLPLLALDYDQFFGSRFSVVSKVHVESVGGHLQGGPNSLFAAIVPLAGLTAFPSGNPFNSTTIATTHFDGPATSADVLVPLSATLNPGSYAIIFGSGQFGANIGGGTIPDNNIDIAGHASYIVWNGPIRGWHNYNYDGPVGGGLRFVVIGTVVPEPSTLAVAIIAFAAFPLVRLP